MIFHIFQQSHICSRIFWLLPFDKLIQLGEKKKKQIPFKENKCSLIISITHSILKQRQSDPTVLDNVLWAVIQECPHKPNAHHSGKLDRSNECEGHLYLESQRRSLEEVTFKPNAEQNNSHQTNRWGHKPQGKNESLEVRFTILEVDAILSKSNEKPLKMWAASRS